MYRTEWFNKSYERSDGEGLGEIWISPTRETSFVGQSWKQSNLINLPPLCTPLHPLIVWNISPLNVLFVYSNLFSWGKIIFATLIHDSTHARLVFLICALNSGQSCLSCPMWISISRKLATWVLISISICKIVCEWFMSQQNICCWMSREKMLTFGKFGLSNSIALRYVRSFSYVQKWNYDDS